MKKLIAMLLLGAFLATAAVGVTGCKDEKTKTDDKAKTKTEEKTKTS